MLFRWGGEEFVVIAASTGYRGSTAVAEKIREAVEAHRFQGVGSVTVPSVPTMMRQRPAGSLPLRAEVTASDGYARFAS
jgi:GGDEF domain-containing protein